MLFFGRNLYAAYPRKRMSGAGAFFSQQEMNPQGWRNTPRAQLGGAFEGHRQSRAVAQALACQLPNQDPR